MQISTMDIDVGGAIAGLACTIEGQLEQDLARIPLAAHERIWVQRDVG
jgi:hypothetical protein